MQTSNSFSHVFKDLVLIHLEDDFLDENLTIIKAIPKCGILEHSTNVVGVIQEQICFKIHINNMHFSLMPSHLYRRNGDGILRQCVTYHEVPSMLRLVMIMHVITIF